MDYSWIKNVCVIDSMHSLLQYLLLVSVDDILNTFFFWGNGISSDVKEEFAGHHKNMGKRPYSWFKFLSKFSFLFKNSIRYWGHDHLPYSKYVIRKHDFELLEDGLMNYNPYKWPVKSLREKLYTLWQGPLCCLDIPYAGYESNCKKIHLTGLSNTGDVYKSPKLSVKSFQKMWDECDESKKSYVNKIFGLDDDACRILKERKKILLTQPLSEDGYLTEEKKVEVYSKIIDYIGSENLVIKIHPREKTNYKSYFPNVKVFDRSIPMQLIMLNGIRFEEAYTIFSSSVFGFPYKIRVGFVGTQISKELLSHFPNRTYNDFHCTDDNVERINIKLDSLCD